MRKRKQDRDGLYVRPNSPFFWASYIDASRRRVRRSTGVRRTREGRKEAERRLAEWKLEAQEAPCEKVDQEIEQEAARTFDDLMLRYLNATEHLGHAERDRYSAKHLYRFFTGMTLAEMRRRDVSEYIGFRKQVAAAGTVKREIGLLCRAINWAKEELEWDIRNPAQRRKLEEAERARWITQAEATALLREATRETRSPHLVDFIRLGLHTGMRKQEMLGLEWRRVDLTQRLIYLESEHQKNGKRGSVPLNQEAREAIVSRARFRARCCPDSPWVFCHKDGSRIRDVRKSFGSTCRKAGIDDFHPHDLRHTCAAWLVQQGVPIREVSELLRHSDIRMTMRYAHLAPENVRTAVTKLESMTIP